jgi:hypothetical protein
MVLFHEQLARIDLFGFILALFIAVGGACGRAGAAV